MKQVAWLDTAPKFENKGGKSGRATDESELTRREQMNLDGLEPMLPELTAGQHLIGYLFDAGPVSAGGMGPTQLTSRDILDWSDGTGFSLSSWEFRTLRRLSHDFLAQRQKSEKPDCPAPYSEQSAQEHRDAVAKKIEEIFFARIARQTQKG